MSDFENLVMEAMDRLTLPGEYEGHSPASAVAAVAQELADEGLVSSDAERAALEAELDGRLEEERERSAEARAEAAWEARRYG